jgi:hypothetical protein
MSIGEGLYRIVVLLPFSLWEKGPGDEVATKKEKILSPVEIFYQ